MRVQGDAPIDMKMPFPVPLDDLASFVPAFNANGPVNAIPYVCAAKPGILATEDLPHFLARGPRSSS
jgi:4-hydroxy-tetrahydrodipicolinate reductase